MTGHLSSSGYFTTDHHELLRKQVRKFAEVHVLPLVAAMEESRAVHPDLSRLIARQGWVGVTVGREHGGMGDGHVAKTVLLDELSFFSGAMGAMLQASQLGTAKIIHFGSQDQKDAWLPAIARGECLPTIAVTEPGSGSHVLGMEMTAVRDGEWWVLNGRKAFVGNSHIGDLHGVVARTGAGSRGLSAFLVEASTEGLTIIPQEQAMGLHGFSFGELAFDDCRVPASALLGREGNGLEVAYSSSVLYGRPNLTAVALGIHRALVAETVAFATRRERYGASLAELPTVRARIGRMQSRLMTARLAAYHAVHLLDRGLPCDAELINAKLIGAESAVESARDAMEVHAAAGLLKSSPVERYLRDAFHVLPPAGTSDIQLIRLAEAAISTTREEWSERFARDPQATARV